MKSSKKILVEHRQKGFTLLELLVAMMIFSLMSVMAYSALANVFKSNEVLTEQEAELKKLQRSMMFIERDLRQLVLRSRSAGYGAPSLPAVSLGHDAEGVIEFTRAGNPNPADLMRSSLQRIRYILDDNILNRLSWNLVDHIDAEPIKMMLLEDVESLKFKFFDSKLWKDNWNSAIEVPKAVEMTLEHKKWGKIIRLFSID
ncbi:MAG: type II secretion system minor pseudopilin GspJ [Cocleimonas sp.]